MNSSSMSWRGPMTDVVPPPVAPVRRAKADALLAAAEVLTKASRRLLRAARDLQESAASL